MMTERTVSGTVYLVGGGPGDPDLLTVKARRLIDRADVLLYDSLTPESIVDSVPETTRTIDVGKRPGRNGDRTTQTEINRLLVDLAGDHETVVRLKGGDPTVFGRGGEEAVHLADRGVPFEIVPGVSSVLATGTAGIPLTHRDHASSLTVVTGHEAPDKETSSLDWDALAATVQAGGTLVVLMGVRRLPDYTAELADCGVDPDIPVAMIQKATWDDERIVSGTLESIVDVRDEMGIEPPALIVIGDVVSVREQVDSLLDRGCHVDVSPTPTVGQPGGRRTPATQERPAPATSEETPATAVTEGRPATAAADETPAAQAVEETPAISSVGQSSAPGPLQGLLSESTADLHRKDSLELGSRSRHD